MDIIININSLLEESQDKLRKKKYVPRRLCLRNLTLPFTTHLPFIVEFEIPENELRLSGYECLKNKVAVFLKKEVLDQLNTMISQNQIN
jgi:hypothetical protein